MKKVQKNVYPHSLSRRDFLKVAAVGTAGLLAGCRSANPPVGTPTRIPPTPTTAPTAPPTSTPTTAIIPDSAIRRPEIIRFYPDVKSKVVHTHHAGMWKGTPRGGAGDNALLNPQALRQMLDASITQLTGLNDARDAWVALFKPEERVAIKVNPVFSSDFWTHVPLVMAVTDCLQEAGVPPEQIVIYDETTEDLRNAGYPINRDGPGVRCHGTNEDWSTRWVYQNEKRHGWDIGYGPGWKVMGRDVGFSEVLLGCEALINMPILKRHNCGITFALKNHYGSIDVPERLHWAEQGGDPDDMPGLEALGELNALPPIKDRTRLVIGDVFTIAGANNNNIPAWFTAVTGDSILMSFDPVAADAVGMQLFLDAITPEGPVPESIESLASTYLRHAAGLGIGTNDPENIDLAEVKLQ